MKKRIVIASTNPVKLNAAKNAFHKLLPDATFEWKTKEVPSGVSNQPMSDAETRLGACNRVKAIRDICPDADYWVGIEGGVDFDDKGEMTAFAWVVIDDGKQLGKARSGSFYLPPGITDLVRKGRELGEADDIMFVKQNSKQKNGAIGLLTNNLIDRSGLYEHAVILAFVPFYNPQLYSEKNPTLPG
ncbi:MAG: inositol monophosphatase [Chloroflexi bacterium HGW-Chloroflexi-3]|nr:MAG: inositol monophosphatase [Chloroflexi bacterium HGW-Chloroflexi-3]